ARFPLSRLERRTAWLDYVAENQTLRARCGRFGPESIALWSFMQRLTLSNWWSLNLDNHNLSTHHFMAEIKRSTLFGKLNPLGYKSIEAATIFCKMRGNAYVETVHWLHQLLQQQ